MTSYKLGKYPETIILLLCLVALFSCKAAAEEEEEENPLSPAIDLILEKNNIEITTGDEKAIIKIISGNGDYITSSLPKGIVSTSVKNNEINITGTKGGKATITVTDGRGKSAAIAVDVKALFREDFNGSSIDESIWIVGTWAEHGGQLGRERCYVEDGYLNLLLVNNNGEILSSAIQTRAEFLYGKWEVRSKPSAVPGVLNSFFTIDWKDGKGTRQEIDIEFLTYTFGEHKGKVHFAMHAQGKQSSGINIDLDFNPSADFHVWGFNVTPEQIEWFVDGKTLHAYKYAENDIKIDTPYQLKLNHWTQAEWIKGPPQPGVTSRYLIDWIQFTPQ